MENNVPGNSQNWTCNMGMKILAFPGVYQDFFKKGGESQEAFCSCLHMRMFFQVYFNALVDGVGQILDHPCYEGHQLQKLHRLRSAVEAPDELPGACPNRHIWQLAQDRPEPTPNCRKNKQKRYYPFWCSFCRKHTQIAPSAFRMARTEIWASSQTCNWAAIIWIAAIDCEVIGVCSISACMIVLVLCTLGRTTVGMVLVGPSDLNYRRAIVNHVRN